MSEAELDGAAIRGGTNAGCDAGLCAATNGNPLFLDGIVRMLLAEGAIDTAGAPGRPFKIPIGVREAIRGRLNGISREANAILPVAAAIGNEFDLDLCRSVPDASAGEARRLFDEASSTGIVTALGQGFRFCHALIRSTVYDELDSDARIEIHGKIANRMEDLHRENIEFHVAELAHHFREAGVSKKAIDYAIRASVQTWAEFRLWTPEGAREFKFRSLRQVIRDFRVFSRKLENSARSRILF